MQDFPCPNVRPMTRAYPCGHRRAPAGGGDFERRGMADALFTEDRARAVLEAAGHPEAELLSFGENAVFAAGRLVIKVGRGAELLERPEIRAAYLEGGRRA